MKVYDKPVELIVDDSLIAPKGKSAGDFSKVLAAQGIELLQVRKRRPVPGAPEAKGKQATERQYITTSVKDSEMNPWDVAHLSAKAMGPRATFIEPDLLQEFQVDSNTDLAFKKQIPAGKKEKEENGYDPDWQPHRNAIWHLGDAYSQLKTARDTVRDEDYTIRIGHLDTGYSATHPIVPDTVRKNPLQRNFVDGEPYNDAHDPLVSGPVRMPGHGTGTFGVLAGTQIKLDTDDGVFNDYLGGAWFADVIPCRIASSVVLLKTSAFADALHYLTQLTLSGKPVQVISMSMGGAPARAWAEAVNAAYNAGITMVTAAGNNYNGFPTQHVIYPARFGRVIAACGATYDLRPYSSSKLGEMQGCYGPSRHMKKALAAFTPNMPWASVRSGNINFSGAGTSCATPQIAAAAAIYYRKYHRELDALLPWQRVEAIRYALYTSALKKVNGMDDYRTCFGNGIVQAAAALAVKVKIADTPTPEDSVPWFPILNTLFKAKPGREAEMYNTELAQLVYQYPELAALIGNEAQSYERVSAAKWRKFRDAVIAHPAASIALKKALMNAPK